MNRKERIDMILDKEYKTHTTVGMGHYCIDAEDSEDCIDSMADDFRSELYSAWEECKENQAEREKKRLELEKLPGHELDEIGEKLDLWKINERQKRLI